MGIEHIEYLVVTGDLTNRASPEEFEKALQFVLGVIKEFSITPTRSIITPGNHDLNWDETVYEWKPMRLLQGQDYTSPRFRLQGDGYLLRVDKNYNSRFSNFSRYFFHPLFQQEYPLSPEHQGTPVFFEDSGIQFLPLNSCWEIDEFFPQRASINQEALSEGLRKADEQLVNAEREPSISESNRILRIALWHHPITGNQKIVDDSFTGRLMQAQFKLCLHGHVHEERADLLSYLFPAESITVVGAGSLDAPSMVRPESVPRLYNLIEINRELDSVRVHTRAKRKPGGAWQGWAVWPSQEPNKMQSFYDFGVNY